MPAGGSGTAKALATNQPYDNAAAQNDA